MKVYCVKFLNECDDIVRVDHILTDSENELRDGCNRVISFVDYRGMGETYSSYTFHEVDLGDYGLTKRSE